MKLKPVKHFHLWEGEQYKNKHNRIFRCLLGLNRDTYIMQDIKSG